MPWSFAKLDLVRYRTRTQGPTAGAQQARSLFLEWAGRQISRWQFPDVTWGRDVTVTGKLHMRGPGQVVIGDGYVFDGTDGRANVITLTSSDAVVIIGRGTYLNGVTILAADRVEVGQDCLVSSSIIRDSDFHTLERERPAAREPPEVAPVPIGNRVWIANEALVLKGVSVGDESVVGAGTVLRSSIPARSVVIGNAQEESQEEKPQERSRPPSAERRTARRARQETESEERQAAP